MISAHAGLILFTDGVTLLDGKAYTSVPGRWGEIPQNGTLQTQDGKADVLLAPGVFLRVGTGTAVRLVSNKLFDVQLEFLEGSAIVDVAKAETDNSTQLVFSGTLVQIAAPGRYRIDSNPPRIAVDEGQLRVAQGERVVPVASHSAFSFASGEVTGTVPPSGDELATWSMQRQQVDELSYAPPKPPERRRGLLGLIQVPIPRWLR